MKLQHAEVLAYVCKLLRREAAACEVRAARTPERDSRRTQQERARALEWAATEIAAIHARIEYGG